MTRRTRGSGRRGGHCRGADRRRGRRVRRRQAAARLLRAPRGARAGPRSSGPPRHARDAGLLVLADGKRGDVAVTAAAYAQALLGSTPTPFGDVPGLGADAVTANPLLGRDALEPADRRRARRRGGRVRARAHVQPGAADVQDLPIGRRRDGVGAPRRCSSTRLGAARRRRSPTSAP